MKYPFARSAVAAVTLGVASVAAFQYPDCANGPLADTTVCDTEASPRDRAAALVALMKTSEKLVNLVDLSPGVPRIGLPPYEWWSEALHGVALSPGTSFAFQGDEFRYATSFPSPITLSAAFDDDLIYRIASVISTEARAFSNAGRAGLDFWTPNINPYKDPRWGRGSETPGEDPFRIKGYVKALVAGLQGNETTRKVIATCKHYAAYDLERWRGVVRHSFDAVVGLQDLSEYYLPPFQQCARDSKAGSIMCSYNALNGTPACASAYLMRDILRDHWRWTDDHNYVTSDCNAVQDFLPEHQNFSRTPAEAAAAAYEAGTDTVCEVAAYPPLTDVVGAYNQSLLSEDTVDTALKRLYEGLARAGYFDPAEKDPYRSLAWSDVNTPEAQSLARQAATDGIVLLKNADTTLPLDLTNRTVALLGFWANATEQMLGGYSGIPPYYHNPLYAAAALEAAGSDVKVVYAPGGPLAQTDDGGEEDTWTEAALDAASRADVLLYFGGTDQSIAAEDRDRDSIAWPAAQLSLVRRLAGLGKPLVVVRLGDQVDDTPLLDRESGVSAILWAGYPGQAGGEAVFDVLTGRRAPAGRLPVTVYPAAYVDAVPMTDMGLRPTGNSSSGSGNPGRTYRWYDQAVLPFGHGLHYTTFEASFDRTSSPIGRANQSTIAISDILAGCGSDGRWSNSSGSGSSAGDGKPHVKRSSSPAPLDLCTLGDGVRITVRNTGNVTSDFVALVFVSGTYGPEPRPLKTLAGYGRVRDVSPGQTVRVALPALTLGALARADERGNTVLYPGEYRLTLDVEGRSEVRFALTGEAAVLDEFPQPK